MEGLQQQPTTASQAVKWIMAMTSWGDGPGLLSVVNKTCIQQLSQHTDWLNQEPQDKLKLSNYSFCKNMTTYMMIHPQHTIKIWPI